MRTTLTIDDKLAEALKEAAYRSKKSFKEVVNDTLRVGLETRHRPVNAKRYKIKPASLGGVIAGIDLDKALRLSDTIEDEEIGRKLLLRK
jgi:hypothetical protein